MTNAQTCLAIAHGASRIECMRIYFMQFECRGIETYKFRSLALKACLSLSSYWNKGNDTLEKAINYACLDYVNVRIACEIRLHTLTVSPEQLPYSGFTRSSEARKPTCVNNGRNNTINTRHTDNKPTTKTQQHAQQKTTIPEGNAQQSHNTLALILQQNQRSC